MKRVGNLLPAIADTDNLLLAFCKARKGKHSKTEVCAFRDRLDDNLSVMREGLLAGTIAVGDYHFFTIRDPKPRRICAASFGERVLHHAILNVCEPVFERYAIDDTYACRPGKGLHRAIDRAQQFCRRFPCYLQLDIAAYFDHISHSTVLDHLARRVKDAAVLDLFARIVHSYEVAPGAGLPIGHLTSQHLANLYLGAYDHQLKETWRAPGYLRYMDDMLIFGNSRGELRAALEASRAWLLTHLGLTIKAHPTLRPCGEGISFLGFRVFPHRLLLARRSRSRYAHRLRALEAAYTAGEISEAELQRRVAAMTSFIDLAQSRGFRQAIHAQRDSL